MRTYLYERSARRRETRGFQCRDIGTLRSSERFLDDASITREELRHTSRERQRTPSPTAYDVSNVVTQCRCARVAPVLSLYNPSVISDVKGNRAFSEKERERELPPRRDEFISLDARRAPREFCQARERFPEVFVALQDHSRGNEVTPITADTVGRHVALVYRLREIEIR